MMMGRMQIMDGGKQGGRARRRIVAAALAVVLALGSVGRAEAADSYLADFGLGVGTVFSNIVYMPTKFVYATLGGITGGFAFLLTGGRMDTAKSIWVPSLGGTYVLTPSMLRGQDPIYFSGQTESASAADDERSRSWEEAPAREKASSGSAY
jgi:hypothetical protein